MPDHIHSDVQFLHEFGELLRQIADIPTYQYSVSFDRMARELRRRQRKAKSLVERTGHYTEYLPSGGKGRWDPFQMLSNLGTIADTGSLFSFLIARVEEALDSLEAEAAQPSETTSDEPLATVEPALDRVLRICRRFPYVARRMKKESMRKDQPGFDIRDEYDTQALFHALLLVEFDDIRPEENAPSSAGSAPRLDFLLKDERIGIEVKKTRPNMSNKDLGDELSADLVRQPEHPDCETLVFFVYDPDHRVPNPVGFANDFEKKHPTVRVVIAQ